MPFTAVRLSSGVVPSNSDAAYLSETDSTSFIVIVVVLMTTEEGGEGRPADKDHVRWLGDPSRVFLSQQIGREVSR